MERYSGPYLYRPIRQLGQKPGEITGTQPEHVLHAVRTLGCKKVVTIGVLAGFFRCTPDHIRHLLFGPRERGEVEIHGNVVTPVDTATTRIR